MTISPGLALRSSHGSPATILLVEDESSIRRRIAKMLRRQGFTVLEASNGVDALAVYQKEGSRVNLLITDIQMPRMSGTELIQSLRATTPGLKVLCITGFAASIPGSLDVDALQKPFAPDALLKKVRHLLN